MATAIAAVGHSNALSDLSAVIESSPYEFLQPTLDLQRVVLDAAKTLLDPLASDIVDAQLNRRNERRRKRKRGDDEPEEPVLQLRQVYTKGLQVKQVWEQARRVLDAACDEVERGIQLHALEDKSTTNGQVDSQDELDGSQGFEEEMSDGEEDEIESELEDNDDDETDLQDVDLADSNGEGEEDIENDSDVMLSDVEEEPLDDVYTQDPNGLNDGFFSIDDFNKQSQFLEQMDARGDLDNPSDEEEIDWDADPLTQPMPSTRPGRADDESAESTSESDEEEDGPTFGNADLDADDSGEDEGEEEFEGEDMDGAMPGLSNTNDIRYADFFEPPPKKPSKTKRMRALPKTQPPSASKVPRNQETNAIQSDIERAMADVRRDLLDSDQEELSNDDEEEDGDLSEEDVGRKRKTDKNISTHEKQRAQIAAEIRRLEAQNVAKKDWTLAGEASAQARPINSLIEEDLEFERTGKPVPVITAEVSEEIEQIIKRRILAREFDEVVRRVPDAIGATADTRRGRVEVDDNKPTAGLGEIYEQEHLKATDPTSYVDKRSAATKKQHDEIDRLWKEVRDQLDVLGNLHFKPKRLDVEVKTVEDKPRIAMEDAQPTTTTGIDENNNTLLAPQEIYRPGTDSKANVGEVMNKSGATMNREELTREEKLRRRRREKERSKKAQGNRDLVNATNAIKDKKAGGNKHKNKKAEKENIIDELKKGGVKVIGKGGELQDIDGKKTARREMLDGKGKDAGENKASASFLKL